MSWASALCVLTQYLFAHHVDKLVCLKRHKHELCVYHRKYSYWEIFVPGSIYPRKYLSWKVLIQRRIYSRKNSTKEVFILKKIIKEVFIFGGTYPRKYVFFFLVFMVESIYPIKYLTEEVFILGSIVPCKFWCGGLANLYLCCRGQLVLQQP